MTKVINLTLSEPVPNEYSSVESSEDAIPAKNELQMQVKTREYIEDSTDTEKYSIQGQDK